ncbi:hypothetical protein IV203_001085 [Nitzschia inconspicua]|uniref:Uncharacterized protein n=1 Tax=Nitzschia inconspicua TaxID=303405 RepID=A0A9K3PT86_9STRA|nr:hypothetical protein IV203_001085 [Nitzschia inconspicua]
MLASNGPHLSTILHLEDEQDTIGKSLGQTKKVENRDEIFETRRRFLNAAAMNMCFFGAAAPVALAASTTESERTRYISGKAPQVPGAKPPDKNNLKGTRRDPDFLRSIADCRNQCQNSASGPDGLAKSKEDCLSECQDICCKTYEQCTFNIVPRI